MKKKHVTCMSIYYFTDQLDAINLNQTRCNA